MAQNPLRLFTEFVSAVSSAKEFLPLDYLATVHTLCERSPAFAQFLTDEIPKRLNEYGETDGNSKVQESGIASTRSRKNRKQVDLSYRPPKSKAGLDNTVEGSGEVVEQDTTAMYPDRLPGGNELAHTRVLDFEADANVDGTVSAMITCHFDDQFFPPEGLLEHHLPVSCTPPDDTEVKALPSTNPNAADMHKGPSIQGRSVTVNDQEQPDATARTEQLRSPLVGEVDQPSTEGEANKYGPALEDAGRADQESLDKPPAKSKNVAFGDLSKSTARTSQSEPEGPPPFNLAVHHPAAPLPQASEKEASTTTASVSTEHPAHGGSAEVDEAEGVFTQRQTPLGIIPSTPKSRILQGEQQSPPTEEVPRDTLLPPHTASVPDSPSPILQSLDLHDLVAEGLNAIHQMSSRQLAVPTGTHSTVLRTLQSDLGGTSNDTNAIQRSGYIRTTTDPREWSSTMWVGVLEAGESRNKKGTILSMLEWMGASIWYDGQLAKLASAAPLTKRGTPRARLATVLLDRLLDGEESDNEPGPVIKRRRLALGSAKDPPSTERSQSILSRSVDQRRRSIIYQIRKGRKLRTMVSKTSLGILLREKIWTYEKMKDDKFDQQLPHSNTSSAAHFFCFWL